MFPQDKSIKMPSIFCGFKLESILEIQCIGRILYYSKCSHLDNFCKNKDFSKPCFTYPVMKRIHAVIMLLLFCIFNQYIFFEKAFSNIKAFFENLNMQCYG